MWQKRAYVVARHHTRNLHRSIRRLHDSTAKPIIDIRDGTFYRQYPSTQDLLGSNPPLFPLLDFSLPNGREGTSTPQYWSITSPSSLARTTFLQILAGQHISIPPTARSYPYLSDLSDSPQHAIKYVGFDAQRGSSVGGTNVRGAYLSSRYESRREETDFTLQDYLQGRTELNALAHDLTPQEAQILDEAIRLLDLGNLLAMPVANLSNGQTRRARIAKSLVARPEVLLLDGPFMGLDPRTRAKMSAVLKGLAEKQQPRVVMSLRPEEGVPEWISHLVVVNDQLRVLAQGGKEHVFRSDDKDPVTRMIIEASIRGHDTVAAPKTSRDGFARDSPALTPGEPLVEINGAKVAYGTKTVLGDWTHEVDGEQRDGLWWTLRRGQRSGIFGANGSGKTTMLSLITSDHPQTYSLPIKLFGRARLPSPGEPGISLFDIQQRMGHSSPEVHAFFPKQLTVRRALESAWADAPMSRPRLTDDARALVDGFLRWFAPELHQESQEASFLEILDPLSPNPKMSDEQRAILEDIYSSLVASGDDLAWANEIRFGELAFSSQRLLLFLRALIKSPDLVILDEALSGIDEATRDKALLFLSWGERLVLSEGGPIRASILALLKKVRFPGLQAHQALLVISHAREDVPGCVREWICLPEPGERRPPRTGTLAGPLELNPQGWEEIWGG